MITLTVRDLKALNRGLYLKNVNALVDATDMGSVSDVQALRDMVEDPEVVTMLVMRLNTLKRKNRVMLEQRDWDIAEILHRVRKQGDDPKVTPVDVAVVLTVVIGMLTALGVFLMIVANLVGLVA